MVQLNGPNGHNLPFGPSFFHILHRPVGSAIAILSGPLFPETDTRLFVQRKRL